MINHNSMAVKIGRGFILSVAAVLLVVIPAVLVVTGEIIDRAAESEANDHFAIFQGIINNEISRASTLSSLVASMPVTINAMASQDRDALIRLFTDPFQKLSREHGVEQMQFHLPPAISFLRLHDLKKFGDDLSLFRKTVLIANKESKAVVGLEKGVAGYGIRAVSPILLNGKHLGTVEFGMSLGKTLLTDFKNTHGIELSIHIINEHNTISLLTSTLQDPIQTSIEDIKLAFNGKRVIRRGNIMGTPKIILVNGLRDFSGNIVSAIELSTDVSAYEESRFTVIKVTLAAALVAVILCIVLTISIHRRVVRPLTHVTEVMDRLASGDLDVSVPKHVSSDEVGRITVALDVFKAGLIEQRNAKENAESAAHARWLFLTNMSHELRSPLNTIIGFAEVMRDDILGPNATTKYAEYANDIRDSGAYLLELINDVLDISKIDAGQMHLDQASVNLYSIISSVTRLISVRVVAAGLTLTSEIERSLPDLFVDQRAVKQILFNLISNSIKFTGANGSIRLLAHVVDENFVALIVNDSGMGIPSDQIERIMRPFEQGDNRFGHANGGTGLGLSLVDRLVKLHGGVLMIESVVGMGTSVTLTLPIAK